MNEKSTSYETAIQATKIPSIEVGLQELKSLNPMLYGAIEKQLGLIRDDVDICDGLVKAAILVDILRGATQFCGWSIHMSLRKNKCAISLIVGKHCISSEGNMVYAHLEAYLEAIRRFPNVRG
jgi:hypothetical protein